MMETDNVRFTIIFKGAVPLTLNYPAFQRTVSFQ